MGESERPKPRRAGPVRLVPGSSYIDRDDGMLRRTVEVVDDDLLGGVWQAIEATCARQTADLALRDQVRWAVAIFGAWQESLPADRDAMPTATAQRRSARSVALMARGALQEGIAFVLEREPGTQLMRSIIRHVLGDRDEDGAVELRAGHLTVRDRDALRVLAAGATQLAETIPGPVDPARAEARRGAGRARRAARAGHRGPPGTRFGADLV